MARIEKTVFISYRRKDISWALAVYQYLTSQKYDVFFDFSSLSSGDFEEVIISNIRARAHFVLILTPTALDRCNEPGDWLRREIETAIDEKRNIIPLFFDEFNFGSKPIAEKLTGKLSAIQRYNGLDIPSGYFLEAMGRLSSRYLNVPLNAVIHPISTEVRKVVKEEQIAADNALIQKRADIQELIKPVSEKINDVRKEWNKQTNVRRYGIGVGILAIALLGIIGIRSLYQKFAIETPVPTLISQTVLPFATSSDSPMQTQLVPTTAEIPASPTLTSTSTPLAIGSTMVSPNDGMILQYVPAGAFTMGSIEQEDEREEHQVDLDAFWIDQTEVTNTMYAMCVQDDACNEPSNTFYYSNTDYANHPVVYVSWNDAIKYCVWVERKLPTEAEWEKAARGKNARRYPWGNDSPDQSLLNYYGIIRDTTEVGKYPDGVSPYGALDMAGNVWEWVSSLFRPYPYSAVDGREDLTAAGAHVVRGGGWDDVAYTIRSANREEGPLLPDKVLGFRCAMDASE